MMREEKGSRQEKGREEKGSGVIDKSGFFDLPFANRIGGILPLCCSPQGCSFFFANSNRRWRVLNGGGGVLVVGH
jgi:hypothetical protein